MWTSTFLSHLSKATSSTSKSNGPAVRYSAIPSDAHGRSSNTAMPNVLLDLDVEETITCFCRFVELEHVDIRFGVKKNKFS